MYFPATGNNSCFRRGQFYQENGTQKRLKTSPINAAAPIQYKGSLGYFKILGDLFPPLIGQWIRLRSIRFCWWETMVVFPKECDNSAELPAIVAFQVLKAQCLFMFKLCMPLPPTPCSHVSSSYSDMSGTRRHREKQHMACSEESFLSGQDSHKPILTFG